MHRSEDYDRVLCLQCGADVSASRDRAYPIGGDDALCFRCALDRGGRYDEDHDRWSEAPKLDGLPNAEGSSAERSRLWR